MATNTELGEKLEEISSDVSNIMAKVIENDRAVTTLRFQLDTVLRKLEAIEQKLGITTK